MKYCRDTMSKYSKLLFQVTPSKLSEDQIKQVEEGISFIAFSAKTHPQE